MKVDLKFVEVEGAREAFGATALEFDLKGTTVGDLVRELKEKYGKETEKVFLANLEDDPNIMIIVNWRKYVNPQKMDEFLIAEGDLVAFAPLVIGG